MKTRVIKNLNETGMSAAKGYFVLTIIFLGRFPPLPNRKVSLVESLGTTMLVNL